MDYPIPITPTKVVVPRRRPEILSRQRLLDQLMEMLDLKLVIVGAPAGYGKTSLIIDLCTRLEWAVCWYSIDSLDRDPFRFINYFIAALAHQFPGFGKRSLLYLKNTPADHLNVDTAISIIINEMYETIHEHFVMVLDDYHLVNDTENINQFVSGFLRHMDDNCHVIVTSRSLLNLAELPVLVARGNVSGLSVEELAFSAEEIQQLFQQNRQQSLSDAEALELVYHTEGWITGLLLSTQVPDQGISNRLRGARVSGAGLYSYLAQQVLQVQSEEIRNFLLWTCFFDEFTPELCQTVLGAALKVEVDWQSLVDQLLSENLFVLSLDEENTWVRYHHLFQDFLRQTALKQNPKEAECIQLELVNYYREHREWERAYQVVSQLSRTDLLIDLIIHAGSQLLIEGKFSTLSAWLSPLDASIINKNPRLLSLYGSTLVMNGDIAQGITLLDHAIETRADESDVRFYAQALVNRSIAHRQSGNYQQALDDAENAYIAVKGHIDLLSLQAEALMVKGITLYQMGKLETSIHFLENSLPIYRMLKEQQNEAIVSMEVGLAYKASGDFAAAELSYQRAFDYWESTQNTVWLSNLLNNLGELQYLKGDYTKAVESLETAARYAKQSGYTRMEAYSLTTLGDLYRDIEAFNEASDVYHQARMITRRVKDQFLCIYLDLAEANLSIKNNDYFQAQRLLHEVRKLVQDRGSDYERNLYLLEAGVVKTQMKTMLDAKADLQTALEFFKAEHSTGETFKASLYLLTVNFSLQNYAAATQLLESITTKISQPGNKTLLRTFARNQKEWLEQMRTHAGLGIFAVQVLSELEKFENELLQMRKELRKKSSVVIFSAPRLVIRSLGKIQVNLNEHEITGAEWQSQVARDLLFLLLAHPDGLTKEEIGEIFWPGSSPSALKMRFKNTIYRLRNASGKDCIIFQDNFYKFNNSLDYEYDAEIFQRELFLAERSKKQDEMIDHLKKAIKQYGGTYLPGIDNDWVMEARQHFEVQYLQALLKISTLLFEQKEYNEALFFSERALEEDRCIEDVHRLRMQIHAAMGNQVAVLRQFEDCRSALDQEFNLSPSDQTEELLRKLTA